MILRALKRIILFALTLTHANRLLEKIEEKW